MKPHFVPHNEIVSDIDPEQDRKQRKELLARTAPYLSPHAPSALSQILTSFPPFIALLTASYLFHSSALWLSLICSVLAGLFLLRIFMIQHDCGHGSLFASRRLNDIVGCCASLFSMVPYYYWRRQHALHHASNGNLDRRGNGDMHLCTVKEYLAFSKWERWKYRVCRNPFLFLTIGSFALFMYLNRLPFDKEKTSPAERWNVHLTNLAIAGLLIGLGLLIGFQALLIILLPTLFVAAAIGIWLFYVQHQFEHTYWKPDQEWSYLQAAMQGSSFYKLPAILRWFTSNIGYHHIHHLAPTIPNYRLKECHDNQPEFHKVYELTLLSSLKTMFLCLWDEEQQRLISMREMYKLYGQALANDTGNLRIVSE